MTKCYDILDTNNTTGNIIFTAANQTEVLRFEANGDAFVRGEKVDNNQQVYQEAAAFFRAVNQANKTQEKPMTNECPHCQTTLQQNLSCEIEEETNIGHDVERCRNILKAKLDRVRKGFKELIGEDTSPTYCQEFGCPEEKIDVVSKCVKCGETKPNTNKVATIQVLVDDKVIGIAQSFKVVESHETVSIDIPSIRFNKLQVGKVFDSGIQFQAYPLSKTQKLPLQFVVLDEKDNVIYKINNAWITSQEYTWTSEYFYLLDVQLEAESTIDLKKQPHSPNCKKYQRIGYNCTCGKGL